MIGAIFGCLGARSVLAYDEFNRSDGALGVDQVGNSWESIEGTIRISSNKAKGTVSGTNYAAIDSKKSNCVVAADIAWFTGETVALVARGTGSSSNDQMRVRITGTVITITKRIGGTNTDIATYNYTWTSGASHNIKLSCIGDNFGCYLDDALILSANNSNALASNTYVGILVSKSGVPASTFDNLIATK